MVTYHCGSLKCNFQKFVYAYCQQNYNTEMFLSNHHLIWIKIVRFTTRHVRFGASNIHSVAL